MEDNEERQKMLDTIFETKDKNEIENLIKTYYPNWLIASTDSYSEDYVFLSENWKRICFLTNSQQQKILFVSQLYFNVENYKILNSLGEYLMKQGYCIRRVEGFVLCPRCNKAIPCIELWELIKNKDNIPTIWKERCSGCI